MFSWLRKKDSIQAEGINPPWMKGQYVTYYLERIDESWAAFELRLQGQLDDSSWVMSGEFKNATGEATAWFRSDPLAKEGELDVVPVKQEIVRRSAECADDAGKWDPLMEVSLALNILLVSRWPDAHALLKTPPRAATFPCNVTSIHELVTDGPGYKKHHALNRKVMLTGVACLSTDGMNNPAIATSFGTNDPTGEGAPGSEDYVDLSHPKRVDHDGFKLTYPATWFLRPGIGDDGKPVVPATYLAAPGGNACAVVCGVTIHRGSADHVAKVRGETVSRFAMLLDTGDGKWMPRPGEHAARSDNAQLFVLDLLSGGKRGVLLSGVFTAPTGDRVAHVRLTGVVSDANPNQAAFLAAMEPAFRGILESFDFN
jgi:hypothetical protein